MNKTLYEQFLDHLKSLNDAGSDQFVLSHYVISRHISEDSFNDVMIKNINVTEKELNNTSLSEALADIFDEILLAPLDRFDINPQEITIEINEGIKNGSLNVNKSLLDRNRKTPYDINPTINENVQFGSVISYLLTYLPEEIDASQDEINRVKDAMEILKQNDHYCDLKAIESFLECKDYDHFYIKRVIKELFEKGLYNHINDSLEYLKEHRGYHYIINELDFVCPYGYSIHFRKNEFTTSVYINEKVYNRLILTNQDFIKCVHEGRYRDFIMNDVVENEYRRIVYINESIYNVNIITQLHNILINVT